MAPSFKLLLRPSSINLADINVSIIIRTLNEQRYLDQLLTAISQQKKEAINYEVVVVDSGSTDETLEIAQRHGCQVVHIKREEFSFGRSLNKGCEFANGNILIMISGHCVPKDEYWLQKLCRPILDGRAQYVYGKQIGGPESHFSEKRIFEKYFIHQSMVPQEGAYCNNANSAIDKSIWEKYRFDEDLTGLEDIELAQRLIKDGGKLAYISDAVVLHYHSESWNQVSRRFEREAIALRQIMPQLHVSLFDTFRYVATSVLNDWIFSRKESGKSNLMDIVCYRFSQYWGTYRGNRKHRKLSHSEKERFFYPK
jgi:glycosyltransferase involved in cell wall biosynthesis